MTNQAYTYYGFASGLILTLFIAIVVTWSYGHFSKLYYQKITRELEDMFLSFYM